MGTKKIAIQTQLWGNSNLEQDFQPIFDEARNAGYEGAECRFTVLKQKERLKLYLTEHSFTLVGVHASPEAFFDHGIPKPELDSILADMQDLNVMRLLISGGNLANLQDIMILADRCRAVGIELLYHNHAYEFEPGYQIFDELLKHPGVAIALDIGWLYRAGHKLEDFLDRYGERIRYFHIKDTTPDQWRELGTGDLDMKAVIKLIEQIPMDWWTVEQDNSELKAFESAAQSRKFLAQSDY
ncbi:sugar phosphate isomerase [Paenibacillus nasutitermitis]|uniref:Sugar phosphate isomerase n=1 Tax=Paenibacillus nasutitermitis TaxID=1652958 RepID=A0A916YUA9_9BACL|nr:sugar phosphate isomerase [Paenibacillus nasutitermitis]